MSLTQNIADLIEKADDLSQNVSTKITSIDQRVDRFEGEARDIANKATENMFRARVGVNASQNYPITPGPDDDTGLLVKAAYDLGHKHVYVHWEVDGKDRNWNTLVEMPIGATLEIHGPLCHGDVLGGNIRTGRSCYATGHRGGTVESGSPMIFRNLTPNGDTYPANSHSNAYDECSLIQMNGNNAVVFGESTYVFDCGGMMVMPYGSAMIRVVPYSQDMPCYVGGGGYHCQFYLGNPLVNNCLNGSSLEVRLTADIVKISSDGPALNVDKGFRRLINKGVSGIDASVLSTQPFEISDAMANLNDANPSYAGTSLYWFKASRGIDAQANLPRVISHMTWQSSAGWTMANFDVYDPKISLAGLSKVAGTKTYIASV